MLDLDLQTSAGPSWKPLPVLVTAPLALLGGLAPTAWLVLVRTSGLLALVLAHRLASRFAGGVAGLLAVVGLLLSPDGGPRFLRLLAEGHSAPVEAALALWAVESHLDDRGRRALVLLTGLGLLRPEAWPVLGLYALWLWRRQPEHRTLVTALLLTIPILWFGGDWWASGHPLSGAGDAQVIDDPAGARLVDGLDHLVKVVVVPVWIGVVVALVTARRRGETALVAIGAAALAWMTVVVAMSVGLRYAALSRFLLPAGAVLAVLGGIGLVRLVAAAPTRPIRAGVVVALVGISLVLVTPRVLGLSDVADDIGERGAVEADLVEVVDAAGGRDVVLACGRVVAEPTDLPQAALAWHLRVPLAQVDRDFAADEPHVAIVRTGGRMQRDLLAGDDLAIRPLAVNGRWSALAVDCPAAVDG